jgi:hypothetical protein
MRRIKAGTIHPGTGTETPQYRAPRGAQQVTVPFPDAWADAWDSYQFAEEACGHSPKSIQTRRTSVLRLAKMYPERARGHHPPRCGDATRFGFGCHLRVQLSCHEFHLLTGESLMAGELLGCLVRIAGDVEGYFESLHCRFPSFW